MDHYARECYCGAIVRYADDGDLLISQDHFNGYFLKKRRWISYATRKLQISKHKVNVMYCPKGHRMFLRKFTKLDI